eukprot:3715280-Rhodomonas_salina.4
MVQRFDVTMRELPFTVPQSWGGTNIQLQAYRSRAYPDYERNRKCRTLMRFDSYKLVQWPPWIGHVTSLPVSPIENHTTTTLLLSLATR